MSHLFLDRHDGRLALYLSGELQFDAADERQYHEPLALAPTLLATARLPGTALRVLILGGGDGLALREVLRVPAVADIHLVDRDAAVLDLARGELADLNNGALGDPRVTVHVQDARTFIGEAPTSHVVLCDLTYPRYPDSAALFTLDFFRGIRRLLLPQGVLAVNAVSPERTPQGFGCIGATLAASGLPAVPYAFALPSFQAEGYGRWGFLYASATPITRRELRRIALPRDAQLSAAALVAGMLLPADVRHVMRAAAPNRRDELLCYLATDAAAPWTGAGGALRFERRQRPTVAPRLTAASGFAAWLRTRPGQRTLTDLVSCLPMARRERLRELLMEWSPVAEALYQRLDLAAFVEAALARAIDLPRTWAKELRRLRQRLRERRPSASELLHHAHRAFAIFLLLLLLANLAFPDNLYAKGSTSSSSHSGAVAGEPFRGLDFSAPIVPARAWWRPGVLPQRPQTVQDPAGQEYPAQPFTAAKGNDRRPLAALMALSRDLQLLETGDLAYAARLPGAQALLAPGSLQVQDPAGQDLFTLLPPAELEERARQLLHAQAGLVARAIAEHGRWLAWVGYAGSTAPGQQAVSEMAALRRIQAALDAARTRWDAAPPPRAGTDPGPDWTAAFPGIYVEARTTERRVAIVGADGTTAWRSLAPPASIGGPERALFHILVRHARERQDAGLRAALEAWVLRHPELASAASGMGR